MHLGEIFAKAECGAIQRTERVPRVERARLQWIGPRGPNAQNFQLEREDPEWLPM